MCISWVRTNAIIYRYFQVKMMNAHKYNKRRILHCSGYVIVKIRNHQRISFRKAGKPESTARAWAGTGTRKYRVAMQFRHTLRFGYEELLWLGITARENETPRIRIQERKWNVVNSSVAREKNNFALRRGKRIHVSDIVYAGGYIFVYTRA